MLKKTRFYPDYCLMQTLLDRPKILQIHYFIKHANFFYFDLQFVLSKVAIKASNNQKTIIFGNSISKICSISNIF